MLPFKLWFLPKVNIFGIDKLPHKSGIYYAIDHRGNVRYVGLATNLYKRWNHQHHDQLEALICLPGGAWLRYQCLPEHLLRYAEADAIGRFNPDLNKQRPKREKHLTPRVQLALFMSNVQTTAIAFLVFLIGLEVTGIPVLTDLAAVVKQQIEKEVDR